MSVTRVVHFSFPFLVHYCIPIDKNQDTLEKQMKLFRERALPDLGSNIKCGNSLIGPEKTYRGRSCRACLTSIRIRSKLVPCLDQRA